MMGFSWIVFPHDGKRGIVNCRCVLQGIPPCGQRIRSRHDPLPPETRGLICSDKGFFLAQRLLKRFFQSDAIE